MGSMAEKSEFLWAYFMCTFRSLIASPIFHDLCRTLMSRTLLIHLKRYSLLIQNCWAGESTTRPQFAEIVATLEGLVKA